MGKASYGLAQDSLPFQFDDTQITMHKTMVSLSVMYGSKNWYLALKTNTDLEYMKKLCYRKA
jgi:hypothetical protein